VATASREEAVADVDGQQKSGQGVADAEDHQLVVVGCDIAGQ
jgi:hypothetical protein